MKKIFTVSFSKRFPLLIIVTITSCIIAVSFITIKTISRIYTTSLDYAHKTTIEHIESMSMVLYNFLNKAYTDNKTYEDELLMPVKNNISVYTAYIVKPTDDDRNYTVKKVIKGKPQIKNLTRVDTSHEFLIRKGCAYVTINPAIEKQGTITYIESYIPLHGNNKTQCLIIQWLAPNIAILQQKHDLLIKTLMQTIAIVISATIIIIIVISIIQSYRTKSLIQELSHSIQSIATGSLDIALNDSSDTELKTIATSFNSLVEKIKHSDQMLHTIKEETLTDIFKKGVGLLKDGKLDEALACFTVTILYKPQSFASYFNAGVCLAKKGQFNDALQYFEKARELNPDNELVLRYIGKIKAIQ
ncbi:MAG: tetratricopeptide repeat protein [Spirochaetota bacterium]